VVKKDGSLSGYRWACRASGAAGAGSAGMSAVLRDAAMPVAETGIAAQVAALDWQRIGADLDGQAAR